MEPNALTHTAGYEFLVPLMDSEDITALPSISGTSLGQSKRQAAICNHSDRRTRTDRSMLGEKMAAVRVHSRRRALDEKRWKKPAMLCSSVHSYTIFTPCQNVRCLFFSCITVTNITANAGTPSPITSYLLLLS